MQKIYLIYLFCASGIIQFFFLAVHLFNLRSAQAKPLFIESLPILYLAATYALWLLVATFISWRTKKYRVPLLMHIPHLFSFLPLIRHIMLAADK
ncbi:MAG TPA: hypothetical protein PLY93_13975, partial [Turneriella sp.]|nr:hypothetical protein [Turneriella sp.]